VTVSGAEGANEVSFFLTYEPALLSVTEIVAGADLPKGAELQFEQKDGAWRVLVSSDAPLAAGDLELLRLEATVPEKGAEGTIYEEGHYGAKHLLEISEATVRIGDKETPVRADHGLHVVSYLGDASGNGAYNTADAMDIRRVLLRLDTGFGAYPTVDPVILGDASGNDILTSLDSRLMYRVGEYAVDGKEWPWPQVPALPEGVEPLQFQGPDPFIAVSEVEAAAGQVVTVPVTLDTAEGLDSVELTIAYSQEDLEVVAVRQAGLTEDFQAFAVSTSEPGVIRVDASRLTPLEGGSGTVLELDFYVREGASGTLAIDLVWAALNETRLTLSPVPEPGPDETDGSITVVSIDVPEDDGQGGGDTTLAQASLVAAPTTAEAPAPDGTDGQTQPPPRINWQGKGLDFQVTPSTTWLGDWLGSDRRVQPGELRIEL
jgi:hypothetical protein